MFSGLVSWGLWGKPSWLWVFWVWLDWESNYQSSPSFSLAGTSMILGLSIILAVLRNVGQLILRSLFLYLTLSKLTCCPSPQFQWSMPDILQPSECLYSKPRPAPCHERSGQYIRYQPLSCRVPTLVDRWEVLLMFQLSCPAGAGTCYRRPGTSQIFS